jgi:hypothetical protein
MFGIICKFSFTFFFAFSLFITHCNAQVAITAHSPQLTPVRASTSATAPITHWLKGHDLFFYADEYEMNGAWYDLNDGTTHWVFISLPENKYSNDSIGKLIESYIPKSRFVPLEDLIEVTDKGIYAEYVVIDASTRKKDSILVRNEMLMSGKTTYGLEVGLDQSTSIRSCILYFPDRQIRVPNNLTEDLFNVVFEPGAHLSYDIKGRIFRFENYTYIYQPCADGAGYYELVWSVTNEKIVQRLAGWIH